MKITKVKMPASNLIATIFAATLLSLALCERAVHIDEVTVTQGVVVATADVPPSPTQAKSGASISQVEIEVAVHNNTYNHQHWHRSKSARSPAAHIWIAYVATPPPPPQPPPSSQLSASPTQPSEVTLSGIPKSGGIPLIDTVNKWRIAYGLNALEWNTTLEANALKTGNDDHGSIETHELNPGSTAQVITPGQEVSVGDLNGDSPFDLSYITWLCEVPTDLELKGQCQTVSNVLHMRYDDTGHHDILCSKNYTAIGCAFTQNPFSAKASTYQGLWVCDLH